MTVEKVGDYNGSTLIPEIEAERQKAFHATLKSMPESERADLIFGRAAEVLGEQPRDVVELKDNEGSTVSEGVLMRGGGYAWFDPKIATFRVRSGDAWYPVYYPDDLKLIRTNQPSFWLRGLVNKSQKP